ncbi:DUF4369 domain-containing protein [Seonamhaeicola sp. ML3]|uniref:DUF4369 domain-containing protein n=1 Tax=Seonamhaeicola sp. ML3 TaxID=2937786 RepID=UPI00200E9E45|nr:DUF4369 domain-containing protein [Seonamhaeicola sp. ML3]
MKQIALLFLALLIISCGEEKHDLTVKVDVEGLKKGTIYLKKINDTSLVTVDSVSVNGASTLVLHSKLESPEMYYLYLDKNSDVEDHISFFADKGITEIKTSLKYFAFEPKITGSDQQKVFEEYLKIDSRFKNENLEIIKESFEAQKIGDTAKLNAIQKHSNSLLKRKYLYTVNFALNHSDSEVAPYLALAEIYDARLNLLDTINNSLSPKVKASKYGKELEAFIAKIKAKESQSE